jgi:hypothetical protein
MDADLPDPAESDPGRAPDKTPAEMTSVEHFLSDYAVVNDPAAAALVPAGPSHPWGTA